MIVTFSRHAAEAAGFPVVGYAIGRRHGGAVVRNRLRRRLREAVRAAATDLEPGAYLVRATPPAATLGFEELCRSVRAALRVAGSAPGGERRESR